MLRFDESTHNVRTRDRYASFDWLVRREPDFLNHNWNMSLVITFYQYRHKQIFGLQFRSGKPAFDRRYAYTFDLNELKQQMIEIFRHANLNFQSIIAFSRSIGA